MGFLISNRFYPITLAKLWGLGGLVSHFPYFPTPKKDTP